MSQVPPSPPAIAALARSRNAYLILAALTLALLLPFLNKAFHIDDPLFLWAARQIQSHPGNPYGFFVNWYNHIDPMYNVTENPPLASYYLAATASLLGWSELAMHAAMLLPAIGVILGTYRLGRRLSANAVLAALAVLASPVFLLSSTTVMCDILMLCLWVWAVLLWIEGLDAQRGWVSLAAPLGAATLVAAAAMTKYFGASLIPLLLAHTLARRRFLPALALLIPVAALIAYQLWTARLYGLGLLSEPIQYVTFAHFHHNRPLPLVLLNLLAFTGGCLLPALLLFPLLVSRRFRWLALFSFVLVLLALAADHSDLVTALNNDDGLNQALAVQLAIFAVGGLAVLVLTIQDLTQRHDADALLLGFWILGTLIFTGFFNWSVNGRSILPMAPAVGILLARRWDARTTPPIPAGNKIAGPTASPAAPERQMTPTPPSAPGQSWNWRWLAPLGLAAMVAFAVAWADQSVADVNRAAAREIAKKYANPSHRLWFEGHWGFQYYAQNNLTIVRNSRGPVPGGFQYNVHAGDALPILYGEDGVYIAFHPGDLVAMALNNSNIRPMPEYYTAPEEEFVRPVTPWLSVHSGFTGAGFYSDYWGSAPFVFGPSKHEQYTIMKVLKPMLGTSVTNLQKQIFEIQINRQ